MTRMTYRQMCDGLAAANEWLSALGMREQQDRIRQHMQRIAQLEEAWKAGRITQATQGDEGRLNMFSLTEAVEFLDVYAAFGDDLVGGLRRRLRDALQGPADLAAESTDSNQARNIMFELNLASRLRSRGLPVELPENPDVLTQFQSVPIYIQCKRPYKEETVPVNIENAASQLRRDLDGAGNSDARGILAISVSRVFNPGKLLYGGPDETTVKKGLGDEVQKLGEAHRDVWGHIQDARIIGIVYQIISPTVLEDIALLTVAQEIIVFPLREGTERDLLQKLANAL